MIVIVIFIAGENNMRYIRGVSLLLFGSFRYKYYCKCQL